MSTKIYLVRHAESKYIPNDNNHSRPLTLKGKEDAKTLIEFFREFSIDKVYSSPYIRALHTVEGIAKDKSLNIELMNEFRERTVGNDYLDNEKFVEFAKSQWSDFDYYLDGGESLNMVQKRGIKGLKKVIKNNKNKNIIIGTHGTWLAVILNYFDDKYNYEFWKTLKMPDVFLLNFKEEELKEIKHFKIIWQGQ